MNAMCIPYTPEAAADVAEAHAQRRYAAQRELAGLLAEAIAHAQATRRLEAALRQLARKTVVRSR
jgi:hypothetical protein